MNNIEFLLENPPERWFWAVLVGISVWVGLQFTRKYLISILENSSKTNDIILFFRDVLIKTRSIFILILSIFCGFYILTLSPLVAFILYKTLVITAIFQLGIWAHRLLSYALNQSGIKNHVDSMLSKGAVNTINTILSVILWSLILLLLLGNLGFQIGPLVTGLGIGGIALALGVQHTLQDIAASLSILFDKPFMVGDFIIVDEFLGTVEYIGIKTTRLLSLSGEQIVFSNNDLLSSRIRNYKKMVERRILFTFQIPYETPYDKVQEIPLMIKEIISSQEQVRFDRAHLKEFASYAFEFEVVYYVLVPEYNTYMDLQQQINFKVIQNFESQGIRFAFPKQAVVLYNSCQS